jgi:L-erythro-3,5-diaminohexanoate dehydrogenase
MTSILITKGQGLIYFFSMATSFTKAALGAEGIGKDLSLIVGNGYAKGHANLTLNILRESAEIRGLFEKLYVSS